MLIWRAKELLEGGAELLRGELESASMRLRRMLVDSVVLAGGALIAIAGLGTIVAGAAIALAAEVGWSWCLVIVGGGLVIASLIVWLVVIASRSTPEQASRVMKEQEMSPKEEIAEAKERLHNAATPGMDPEYAPPPRPRPEPDDLAGTAIEFAKKNPLLVGSAAFLVLSVLGPFRVVRLASRGIALAGLASSLMDKNTLDGHSPTAAAGPARQAEHKPPTRTATGSESPPAVRPIGMNARGPAAAATVDAG